MKETIQANIGSVAFTLDRDAYTLLKDYMDDIRSRLPNDDTETLDDIERHFAEIFHERITSPMQVVTLEMTRTAIDRMGSPADFGENTLRPLPPRRPVDCVDHAPTARWPAYAEVWPNSSASTRCWYASSPCC